MTAATTAYCRICEAACGLRVDRDAAGAPTRLWPDRDHPVSAGFACAKGTRFLEVARHPDRLRYPMRRDAHGRLQRVAWDDALDGAGKRLRAIVDEHGPHAVGIYYGNPMAFNARGTLALVRFMQALGTRNIFGANSQDCANKFAAGVIMHGSPVIHPVPDLARCDLAVFFGSNPAVSQSSFVHLERGSLAFDRLVERGARVVWVDPRRTESARRWGEHLPIRAGSDVWLILALLNLLADRAPSHDPRVEGLDRLLAVAALVGPDIAALRTGIPAGRITDLAGRIRRAKATALHLSVGVNMGPFGTLSYVALQALAYVTGNYDAAGGSLFTPLAGTFADLLHRLGVGAQVQRSRIGGFESVMDALPGGVLADEILTPGRDRIRAMIVMAGDPVHSIPGSDRLAEAFDSLEQLVCIDLFENHTGRLADVLLPATSWLERWDAAIATMPFQTTPWVQTAGPVMDPPGEARSEGWTLAALARAMGKPMKLDAIERWVPDRWLPSTRHGIRARGPEPRSYLGRGPRTPGRRVRFWHVALEPEIARIDLELARAVPVGGFVLIGRRRRIGHNSWLHGGVRDGDAENQAWMARSDMDTLGARDGDAVYITSAAGEIRIHARAHESVLAGTVVVPHGLAGVNVNSIIPSGVDAIERVSGNHVMTGIAVEVRV
ncbi:MAG: molybdopterin-dependent oxidoreductase [Deltaproteobacteria bacterium]